VVSSTPRPHFTPGKDPVPILQKSWWAPWPIWTGGNSRSHRDSIPDRPARCSVAIPAELPDPHYCLIKCNNRIRFLDRRREKYKILDNRVHVMGCIDVKNAIVF